MVTPLSLRYLREPRVLGAVIISIVGIFILTSFFHIGAPIESRTLASKFKLPGDHSTSFLSKGAKAPALPKPANETLDFQEIIYLSMPYRTDRQDQLSLIAAVTGLKLTMIPGVTADSIHEKAMPGHVGGNDMTGTPPLGIWRAHANVWRHMIDNDIQSALIIEDDVDWEVNIKDIMGAFNWQLRYNNTIRWGADVKMGWKEDCPYGCDWDELFIGQCGGKPNKNRLDLHSIFAEPHSPALSTTPKWVQKEFNQFWNLSDSAGIRVISPTWEPLCLMGYALTRMGAMRLLYHIGGWKPFGHPVDNEIAWKTSAGKVSGYTLSPPLLTSWRIGGSQDSDNDPGMNAKKVNNEGPSKGHSFGLKNSVRKNLDEFFKKDYWGDIEREREKMKEEIHW